ncbi:MAG: hypothetical protein ACRDRP_16395 [Pseudonocardiaceae bacterium]
MAAGEGAVVDRLAVQAGHLLRLGAEGGDQSGDSSFRPALSLLIVSWNCAALKLIASLRR